MFAPNTYLIGAQKSGTTYLASLLDRHPDVCVCDPKEPQFFTQHFETGAGAYEAGFRDKAARITIDASTTYTFLRSFRDMDVPDAPGLLAPVPERIRDAAPEARFIYVMRDPVDRAVSAYRHHQRQGGVPGGEVSLRTAFDNDPMLVLIGRYADQIERYLAVFPIERFLFLRFEEVTRDVEGTLARCCAHLGLDPVGFEDGPPEGETHAAHGLTRLGRFLDRNAGVKQALRRALPAGLTRQMSAQFLRRDPDTVIFHDRTEMGGVFADDRQRVLEMTGLAI